MASAPGMSYDAVIVGSGFGGITRHSGRHITRQA